MRLRSISPREAARMAEKGAVLVDVRETSELRKGSAPGAHHAPLTQWEPDKLPPKGDLIFFCRSGSRTTQYGEALAASVRGRNAFAMEGGFEAWKRAGLPHTGGATAGDGLFKRLRAMLPFRRKRERTR